MATPASPKAPERESGEIVKKGTAVDIALALLPLVLVCATTKKGNDIITIAIVTLL